MRGIGVAAVEEMIRFRNGGEFVPVEWPIAEFVEPQHTREQPEN